MVSTQDFESCDPSSNPGRTFFFSLGLSFDTDGLFRNLKRRTPTKLTTKTLQIMQILELKDEVNQKILHVRFFPVFSPDFVFSF